MNNTPSVPAPASPTALLADDPTEAERVASLRAQLPAVLSRVFLNTGTSGPLPRVTADAMIAEVERELSEGRAAISGFARLTDALAALRGAFARVLGADADEVAVTRHTTDGVNIVCWGVNWQPGDELLTTTLEHEGGLLPAFAAARRFGVDVRVADLGTAEDPGRVLEALDRALTPRTRLLVVSHVSWNTGARLPLAEIAALAHRRGALVVVDGAQGAGAVPVDVHALGVDAYAASGQKWLCGPEGVGALYVRRDRLSLLRQTYVGYYSLKDFEAWSTSGDFLPAAGARRFEVGTVFRPAIHGMVASLRFLERDAGERWAHARIAALAALARARIAALPGVRVLTPGGDQAGLVAFEHERAAPDVVVAALAARGIVVRSVPLGARHVLRVSTGFYNTPDELAQACAALGESLAGA